MKKAWKSKMTKKGILEKYPPAMENLLLILHEIQASHPRHYLSEKDMALVAAHLKTTCAVVLGVASYYTLFSLKPRGKHIIRICRSPVCHMTDVGVLIAELQKVLKIDVGQTTPDKLFTLETTECLGQCHIAPVMAIDETIHGNLTARKIRTILHSYRPKRSPSGTRRDG